MIAFGEIISRLDLSPAKAGELFVGSSDPGVARETRLPPATVCHGYAVKHAFRQARFLFDLFTYLTMMGYEELRQ